MSRTIPRSILYTPALSVERIAAARSFDADVHLIDLEDSVPPLLKPQAREICVAALDHTLDTMNVAVRINPLESIDVVHDVATLVSAQARPGFVFMTMVKSAVEPVLLRAMLASAGWWPQIYVTVETAEAVSAMDGIAAASDGLILGSADLAATLGIEISWIGLLAARQAMVLACARHGTACIDTGNFRLNEPAALKREIRQGRALGFHGKGTVHPKELDAINRAYRPCEGEMRAARRIVDAVHAAGDGIAVVDGRMVGPPFVRRAREVIGAGEAWLSRFGPATTARSGAGSAEERA